MRHYLKDKAARLEDFTNQQQRSLKDLANKLLEIKELEQGVKDAYAECDQLSQDAKKLCWNAVTLKDNSLELLRQTRDVVNSLSIMSNLDLENKQAYDK